MELLLGSHVRELGNRVGKLAGFELEPGAPRIRCLLFSADGDMGPSAAARPLSAVSLVHDDGEIELHPYSEGTTTGQGAVIVSRATRLRLQGRDVGRLAGIECDAADRSITGVFARHHWWSRRTALAPSGFDGSTPGEIRLTSPGTRAA
jgi:hypothetical protein